MIFMLYLAWGRLFKSEFLIHSHPLQCPFLIHKAFLTLSFHFPAYCCMQISRHVAFYPQTKPPEEIILLTPRDGDNDYSGNSKSNHISYFIPFRSTLPMSLTWTCSIHQSTLPVGASLEKQTRVIQWWT